MQAVVTDIDPDDKSMWLRIAKDPFPVCVKKSQVSPCDKDGKVLKSKPRANTGHNKEKSSKMPKTDSKPSARELRNEAKALGVKDYDEMSRKELVQAIKVAKKGGTKSGKSKVKTEKVSREEAEEFAAERQAQKSGKAKPKKKGSAAKAAAKSKPAKKAAAKPVKATKTKAKTNGQVVTGDNPFRKGSNLHVICGLLLKGGKRESLAEKLSAKTDLHPYSGNDVDLGDYDKRILLAAGTLRDKHGFQIERSGRGLEGKIKAIPPKAKAKK